MRMAHCHSHSMHRYCGSIRKRRQVPTLFDCRAQCARLSGDKLGLGFPCAVYNIRLSIAKDVYVKYDPCMSNEAKPVEKPPRDSLSVELGGWFKAGCAEARSGRLVLSVFSVSLRRPEVAARAGYPE